MSSFETSSLARASSRLAIYPGNPVSRFPGFLIRISELSAKDSGRYKRSPILILRLASRAGARHSSRNSLSYAVPAKPANCVYGTQILINESTAQAIGSQFETGEMDTISVKGKTETTRIFELLSARQGEITF